MTSQEKQDYGVCEPHNVEANGSLLQMRGFTLCRTSAATEQGATEQGNKEQPAGSSNKHGRQKPDAIAFRVKESFRIK
jgi:hypothetical protein